MKKNFNVKNKHTNHMRPILILFALLAGGTATSLAQNIEQPFGNEFDRIFEQMRRQMEFQMRTDTQSISRGGQEFYQMSPDSSSFYYFRIDTSFSGGQEFGGDFFKMDPFNGDGTDGMDAFNEMLRQIEGMHRQLGVRPWGFEIPLAEEPLQPADNILPEERIRQQEQQQQQQHQPATKSPPPAATDQIQPKKRSPAGAPTNPKPEPPAPTKPRIKTSRI
jgi:hypothetical protein